MARIKLMQHLNQIILQSFQWVEKEDILARALQKRKMVQKPKLKQNFKLALSQTRTYHKTT